MILLLPAEDVMWPWKRSWQAENLASSYWLDVHGNVLYCDAKCRVSTNAGDPPPLCALEVFLVVVLTLV